MSRNRDNKFLARGEKMLKLKGARPLGLALVLFIALAGTSGCLNNFGASEPLLDDKSVYLDDQPGGVVYFYLTVSREKKQPAAETVSMAELNSRSYLPGEARPALKIALAEGTAAGPGPEYLGFGQINVRGKSTAESGQKSYRIKLNRGSWRGQKIINLNKHPYDLTRVRNKLSFDYFKTIPNFVSLRTQFVILRVKDQTVDPANDQFVDYGLYTQIEQPNKAFLQAHGLDDQGQLYKAEFFEFQRYPDQIKNKDAPGYSVEKFEEVLEIKGNDDHHKLIAMLNDVNNYQKDINQVVAKHFNLDNLLTWLAVNILVQNVDSYSQNFMLYSPSNSDTWYFLPWDYDGAWGYYDQTGIKGDFILSQWQHGLSNYWSSVLINRLFREPKYLKLLTAKVEQVAKLITPQKTRELLAAYYPVVAAGVKRSPDRERLPARLEYFEAEYQRLPELSEQNRRDFYNYLNKPMPFFLGEPELISDEYLFAWDASFDLQGEELIYLFQLSSDPGFARLLISEELPETEFLVDRLRPGVYYWRVTATDAKGNWQVGFDIFTDPSGKRHFGVKQFIVK